MKKIIAYKRYFSDFISTLSQEERGKIKRALDLFKVEDRMPRHYIKFIRDGLYEFRVSYGNNELKEEYYEKIQRHEQRRTAYTQSTAG